MRVRLQKWGNSLAIRIPKVVATEAALDQGSALELQVENGAITLKRVPEHEYSLEELLAEVTPQNLHGEVNTGGSVGREEW
jgi:antitoxin MazE